MKKNIFFLFFYILLINPGCTVNQNTIKSSLITIPSTTREMKVPGFWIKHHPFPDQIILTAKEIERLNYYNAHKSRSIKDITKFSSLWSGKKLISYLKGSLNYLKKKNLYIKDGDRVKADFYMSMEENMDIKSIPDEIKTQFGFVIKYASQRYYPTEEGLYEKSEEIEFDRLQVSSLDFGTPIAVLHKSIDQEWYYIAASLSNGWIKADKIVLCSLDELKDFTQKKSFVVVTKAKGDIFLNDSLTNYYDYVRMGVKLPFIKKIVPGIMEVMVPLRKEDGSISFQAAYMHSEDVNEGYLPYTPRNIIRQAFQLLNTPYGWGGINGEQDCSRFIQEIFATVGISLPRNSRCQAKVGLVIGDFNKNSSEEEKLYALFTKAVGGITILKINGHIMLFIGIIDGNPYVIHSMWAYNEKYEHKEIRHVVNRVAVTDLSLGSSSEKGSFLKRLTKIIKISNN